MSLSVGMSGCRRAGSSNSTMPVYRSKKTYRKPTGECKKWQLKRVCREQGLQQALDQEQYYFTNAHSASPLKSAVLMQNGIIFTNAQFAFPLNYAVSMRNNIIFTNAHLAFPLNLELCFVVTFMPYCG